MRRHVARRTLFLFMGLLLLAAAGPVLSGAEVDPQAAESPVPEGASGEEAVALTLREVLMAALENNLDILVRRYEPLKSELLVTIQGSAFDPLLTGEASSRLDEQKRISSFIGPFSSEDKTHNYTIGFRDPLVLGGSYEVNLTASDNLTNTTNVFGSTLSTGFNTNWQITFSQPLLRNLGPDANRWQVLVARNDLGVSEELFRQTVLDTLSAAEKAYWDLNFALMDLRTKRASLQLAKDFLEQNRIKVRVGTLAPIEITQAEAGVADREEGVIVAENSVRTAEDALRQMINVPRDSPVWSQPIRPSDAPPLAEVALVMEEAVAAAETSRPDLAQARLNVKSKETELFYRKNQRRWGLDFQGTYGALGFASDETIFGPSVCTDDVTSNQGNTVCLQSQSPILGVTRGSYGDALDDLRDRNQVSWIVGLNLSVPIGNRLAAANFLNAEHALSQARYDLQRLEQLARVEVRNAVRKVETDLKRVKAAQVNVRLQREKLAAEQKKFENGMSTSFQVLQFQNDLATAESRENQAIVDYNKSLAELERVKGTLLEARQMLLPRRGAEEADEQESAGAGSGRSVALRGLWDRRDGRLTWNAAALAAPVAADRVLLPDAFVFDGRRIVGRGPGVPATPPESNLPRESALP